MNSRFKPLVRLRIRHSYYKDGVSHQDCLVQPSSTTTALLQRFGLIFRGGPDGGVIYAEVEAGSDSAVLRTPPGRESLRIALLLRQQNPQFEQYTSLPPHRPAATIFHFANLWDDETAGEMYLTDPVTRHRMGEAVDLVTSTNFSWVIPSAAPGSVRLTNIFGKRWDAIPYKIASQAAGSTELSLSLGDVGQLTEGRYAITDDQANTHDIYYAKNLDGRNILGIIELFSSTENLTADGSDRVPDKYHFLDGDAVNLTTYSIQFEALATIWRYKIMRRYDKAQMQLNQLTVAGGFPFTSTFQENSAVFTSEDVIPLAERPRQMELQLNKNKIQTLPDPAIGNSLRKGEAAGSFVSEMNIYV